MTSYGTIHLITSFMAIGAGGGVVLIPKGTRWHRTLGHLYAMSMLGVLATAFAIYDLTGSFGPFHFAAIAGTITLVGGMWTVLMRRPKKNWIHAHAAWMSWSYIGLMAAFCAESMTRFGVMGVGWWLVKTRLPSAVAATPAAMRRDRRE